VIRFSAALVVVAIGVLIGGVATSKLTLVYIAIAVSAAALVMLAIGVALKREELFGEGQVLSPAGAGDSPVFPAPGRNVPVAPQVTPFPGSAAVPIAQSGRGTDSGLSDAARGAAEGGWDRTGHDRVGQQSAFGRNQPRNPRIPWPTADAAPGRPGAESTPHQADDQARPPWATSGAGQDVRSDRDRDTRPPWDATGSGQDKWSDRDRVTGRVSDWQPGTQSGPPGGTDASSYGGSHDNTGRPPLPGRHSRNVGADDPWSPPARAESGSTPEPPSPFSSAPRRVPGATLGPAVSDDNAWDSKRWDNPVVADESAATPSDPADDDAPEAVSPSETSTGSGWSGSGWAWSSPLTDDAAKSAVTGASGDAAASGDTAASGADDDDWPSRYSWLEDDETGKPEDPDDLPSASTTSSESSASSESPASPANAVSAETPTVRPAPETGDDVRTTSDREPNEDAPLDTPTDMTDADASDGTDEPNADRESDVGLVAVLPGVPRYHERNCILIRFMPKSDVQHLTIPEAEKLGCTPCTACQTEDLAPPKPACTCSAGLLDG
jgi:hypothetical protein